MHRTSLSFLALALALTPATSCSFDTRFELPSYGVDPRPSEPMARMLIEREWRLYSDVFAYQPAGGFPIDFRRSGKAVTDQLSLVKAWSLDDRNTLRLFDSAGRQHYVFTFDARRGVFAYAVKEGSMAGLELVIGPVGYTDD